jgi:putative YphP/YqiW family bacilliredoxin
MFERIQIGMPMYDEDAVQPMRDELIAYGFQELKTPEEVDQALENSTGTALVVVNSVCGCAAGSARPGVGAALQSVKIPDKLFTAFAGQDREAVQLLRQKYLKDYQPSSPSMAIFKDGKVVYMMERYMIEGRRPDEIARELNAQFEKLCSHPGPSIPQEQYAQVRHAVACGSTIPRNF